MLMRYSLNVLLSTPSMPFISLLLMYTICYCVAGLLVVCYFFAFDSTDDAGAGRCDVAFILY